MKSPIKSNSPGAPGRLPSGLAPIPAKQSHPKEISGLFARYLALLGGCLAAGCGPSAAPAASPTRAGAPPAVTKATPPAAPEATAGVGIEWASETRSPRPLPSSEQGDLSKLCDGGDQALSTLAGYLAERDAEGAGEPDMGEVNFRLRALGSPYVWPRIWKLAEATLEPEEVQARMQRWLDGWKVEGQRRCGVASVKDAQGTRHLVAIAADALADLEAVPTQVRPSQWLEVRATLHVPLSDAKLVVLGPRGAPHSVPTSLKRDQVTARFSADRAGTWKLQILGTTSSGPRPVAEAVLAAGQRLPGELRGEPVPGEAAGRGAADAPTAIFRMVNAAREIEGLPRLERAPKLDELARAHAEAMRDSGRIAHDVGGGNPQQRIERAGIPVRAAGENVAHAASPERAHRALWESPSHRGNLLLGRFDSVGIGVAQDADGSVWVCEMFADLP